jgi:phosphoglycerate dehydrogenase-like enzyme
LIDLIVIPGFNETSPARLLKIQEAAPRLRLLFVERKSLTADAVRGCEVIYGYPPPELLREAEGLAWLHLPSAGIEPYGDLALYGNRSVTLTNSSGVYGAAIAEHVLGMALAMLRQFPFYIKQQAEGGWSWHAEMRELAGSRVLICGMGDLGRRCAEKFRALGCETAGVRKVIHDIPPGFSEVYGLNRLREAVGGAEIVVSCLPATRETVGVFNREIFTVMRPDAIFINVGRGSAVVERDLIDALERGRIAGAALDVFEDEPLPEDNALRRLENVMITPHCSGASPVNADRCFELFFDLLGRYIAGKRLYNTVDFFAGY